MPESPSADSMALQYDAFLSYSRADGAAVRRIQRFLESYRPPGRSTRLKVYLDETDMRGGSLPDNLSVALSRSRVLVVCWSDNAARSQWVNAEIAEFRKLGRPNDIAVTHVAGDGPIVRHEAFAGLTPIEHDLRNGWFGWFLKSKARIELLRLIALLTNVEMRVLHNWARRRQLINLMIGFGVALLPVAGVLSVRQPRWEPLASELMYDEMRMQPVACEIVDGKLWAAAWSEAAGQVSGARDYFVEYQDVLEDSPRGDRTRTFPLAKRALPEPQLESKVLAAAQPVRSQSGLVERAKDMPQDEIRIARPRPDRFVLVLPILLTAAEQEEAEDIARTDNSAVPETKMAFVVAYKKGSMPRVEAVADMSPPRWVRNTSPGRAISVVWQGNDEIWIGIAGEREETGGLWHSVDGGRHWNKINGFFSVTSLDLVASAGGKETLLVAEQSFRHPSGGGMTPGESRLMERVADGDWVQVNALPYGSNSEIEVCGTLPDGKLAVRVDGAIFRDSTRSLFRSVLDGS